MIRCLTLSLAGLSCLLAGSLALAEAPPRKPEPKPNGSIWKPGAYNLIEGCRPSLAAEDVRNNPFQSMTVSCQDPCIEDQLNAGLAGAPANRLNSFAYRSVLDLERAAGLNTCKAQTRSYSTAAACFGMGAPDIIAKIGLPCHDRLRGAVQH